MSIAYFDCFSGAAGDMILGALIDAGLDADAFRAELRKLPLVGYDLRIERVIKQGFAAVKFDVLLADDAGGVRVADEPGHAPAHDHSHHHEHTHPQGHEHKGPHAHDHGHSHDHDHSHAHSHAHGHAHAHGNHAAHDHRRLSDITAIIERSTLTGAVKDRARRIFTRLAEAEAAVHGTTVDEIHFHEVGAVDAIVDIVGACIALERLNIEQVHCSPIPTGGGVVRCEHGVMPVPAPATAELLKGVPLAACEERRELTTPTAAAILTTVASSFGPLPAMTVRAIGCGAGTRDGRTRPNLLRVLIGEAAEPAGGFETDSVVVLEANLDDATGEQIGHAVERLFAAGALDVFTIPLQMKKQRPGVCLSVLAAPQSAAACEEALFRHTTTFGVRRHTALRSRLRRESRTVETPFGPMRVKLGSRGDELVRVAPEYDDCAAAADRHQVPLSRVMQAAVEAWRAAGRKETP